MFTPFIKKVLLIGGGFWLFCFALSKVALYWMTKDTPPFLGEMFDHLAENPRLVTRLGENALPALEYNEYDMEKDSLPYTFSLRGEKGELQIKGYAIKQQGQWVPVKSDTLFTPTP
jgi:hypothetical protein